jgi:predicted Na+-dependent transporter
VVDTELQVAVTSGMLPGLLPLSNLAHGCALRRDGSEYKGSPFNILSLLAALFILTPLLGLVFAYWSYGTLWG